MTTTKNHVDLYPHLAKSRRLIVDFKVAQTFDIPKEALLEIVREQIGPEPMPSGASGHFWFLKGFLPSWKHWASRADDEDVNRAAEIIRKHDEAQRVPEYGAYYDDDARSFLITVFKRRRK